MQVEIVDQTRIRFERMSSTAARPDEGQSIRPANATSLRRTLKLSDLILYGIVVIQPVAPMSSYGVLAERGHGHVTTTILVAMVAMLLTAVSYGRMARVH